MPSVENVRIKIQEIVEAVAKERVDLNAKLIEKDLIDSVVLLEVIMELEEVFSITVDPFDMTPEDFATIETITSYVLKKLN